MAAKKKQHVPVFVSSTYEDMLLYRDAVQNAIQNLRYVVMGMEYFGSADGKSLEYCLEEVRASSVYICLIGMRYGSVDEQAGLSYTHLEYQEAKKMGIPILAYILSEEVPILPKLVDTGEKAAKLAAFKEELKANHMVSFFTSPTDVAVRVTQDIVSALEKVDNIEVNKTKLASVEAESHIEIYSKFMIRPKKYVGRMVELSIKIRDKITTANGDPNFARGLGLSIGDIVQTNVAIIDADGAEVGYTWLFADGRQADILENCTVGQILNIRAKLSYVIVDEIRRHDKGIAYLQSAYTNIILVDVT